MFLSRENVAEVWQAGKDVQVPAGTMAYHLVSHNTYPPGTRLKRADQHGKLLVCRQQSTIQLRDLKVLLRRGQAAPCVHVVWCSLELVSKDLPTVAGDVKADAPLRFTDLEERLAQEVHDALRDVHIQAEGVDLRNLAAYAGVQHTLVERIKVPGFHVADVTLRRVLTQAEYEDEQRVWLEFQHRLDWLLQDDMLAQTARSGEVDKALAAIENDRIRALLTQHERTLAAAGRLAKYFELFPPQARHGAETAAQPCPHPHCRVDLSIGQTFVCRRCHDTLHVWHRSRARPTICDECRAAVITWRLWLAVVAAMLLVGAVTLAVTQRNIVGDPTAADGGQASVRGGEIRTANSAHPAGSSKDEKDIDTPNPPPPPAAEDNYRLVISCPGDAKSVSLAEDIRRVISGLVSGNGNGIEATITTRQQTKDADQGGRIITLRYQATLDDVAEKISTALLRAKGYRVAKKLDTDIRSNFEVVIEYGEQEGE